MKYLIILFILFPYFLHSSDWRLVDDLDNTNSHIFSISCPDSNNCYVMTQYTEFTRLYKSEDQGKSWNIIYQSDPFNETGEWLINAEIGISPHPDYYFMSMWDYTVMKKSIDGGKTFERIQLDTMDGKYKRKIRAFTMYNENIGFAISGDWYFITHDGWSNFIKLPKINYDGNSTPVFLNDSIVVMIYETVDTLGMLLKKYNINTFEWSPIFHFPGLTDTSRAHEIFKLFFVNDSLGWGCGEQNTGVGDNSIDLIYRTTDGGYNWELQLKKLQYPSYGLQDIAFFDAKNGVSVGQGGKIWTTKDSGNTWILNDLPEEMSTPLTMDVAWAGQHPLTGTFAMGGGLFRYEGDFFDFTPDTTEDTTSVRKEARDILGDIDIRVQQHHSRLYVSLEDEHFRKYSLQIFDIMGNILLEQEMNSGIGTLYMPVDISALTNGAYLYMISTGGVVAKTGKVILIHN
ncbi:hypothetical protein ACFLSQ_05590 [Bacteroidota bacterium]